MRVCEGRAVSIAGNPAHPLNRGGLCPKGHAGLQVLYDPDRLRGPMRKRGGRSSRTWEAIPWEEALDTVAARLRAIREASRPEALLVWGGRFPGSMRALFERLATAYGTPNLLGHDSIGSGVQRLAMFLQQGVYDLPACDMERTSYLMAFGANLLESWRPTGYSLRCYGEMRRGRPGVRGHVVVVDPRCGVGASKADEWVPIRPGTDAAFALGMAHVIVKEGRYDREFVAEHVFGFESWTDLDRHGATHEGFREMVLREYPPDRVAAITGVEAQTIVRLAREFATTRPALAVSGRGIGGHPGGVYAHMAVHALNALCGSIERPGGVLTQQAPPLVPWPDPPIDAVARAGAGRARLTGDSPIGGSHAWLLDAIESGEPYPVEAALVYYVNPLFSAPEPARWRAAFDRIPFVVSFSPFMDETTERADLVLPEGTYLERLEDASIPASVGFPVLALRQPVVEPLYDTRHTGSVVLDLARRIGGSVAEAFPWASYEEALKARLGGMSSWKGSFEARSPDELMARLKERGVWVGPPYAHGDWKRSLATPSGRFELFAQAWRRRVEEQARRSGKGVDEVLVSLGIRATGDAAFMPHHEPREEGSAPFHLVNYKTMMHAEGRGANQPWLQESFGVQLVEGWEPWVEINDRTARELGIQDRDEVWVESPRGRLKMRAHPSAGVRPDTVCVPYEYGHAAGGRWAVRGVGNLNEIVDADVDPATGATSGHTTRVRVVRA